MVTTGLGLLKDKVVFELSQSTETQDSVKQRKGKRKKAIQEGGTVQAKVWGQDYTMHNWRTVSK